MNTNFKQLLLNIKSELTRNNALAICVLVLAAVGVFNAIRFGVASLDYSGVKNTISEWQNDQSIQSKEEYEHVRVAVQRANLLHYSNPLYADLAGQIKEWGVIAGFESSDALQEAKVNYLQATKVRPLWPVTWANLAMVKWRLQEFDDEMLRYLKRADQLGSQSKEVHLLFTRLGLALYNANHPMYTQLKDSIHNRIRLGLRNPESNPDIVAAINSADSLNTVCRWLQTLDPYTAEKLLTCL